MDAATIAALVALIVAILAFVVAFAQALQQYFVTGQLIRLCDSVVFGALPGHGRRVWQMSQLRFRVVYEIPQIGIAPELWPSSATVSLARKVTALGDVMGLGSNTELSRYDSPLLLNSTNNGASRTSWLGAFFKTHAGTDVPDTRVGEASWASFVRTVHPFCQKSTFLSFTRGDADRCPAELPTVPMPASLRDTVVMALMAGMECTAASFERGSVSMQGAVGTITSAQHPVLGPIIHFSPRLTDAPQGFGTHGSILRDWLWRVMDIWVVAGGYYNRRARISIKADLGQFSAGQPNSNALVPLPDEDHQPGGSLRYQSRLPRAEQVRPTEHQPQSLLHPGIRRSSSYYRSRYHQGLPPIQTSTGGLQTRRSEPVQHRAPAQTTDGFEYHIQKLSPSAQPLDISYYPAKVHSADHSVFIGTQDIQRSISRDTIKRFEKCGGIIEDNQLVEDGGTGKSFKLLIRMYDLKDRNGVPTTVSDSESSEAGECLGVGTGRAYELMSDADKENDRSPARSSSFSTQHGLRKRRNDRSVPEPNSDHPVASDRATISETTRPDSVLFKDPNQEPKAGFESEQGSDRVVRSWARSLPHGVRDHSVERPSSSERSFGDEHQARRDTGPYRNRAQSPFQQWNTRRDRDYEEQWWSREKHGVKENNGNLERSPARFGTFGTPTMDDTQRSPASPFRKQRYQHQDSQQAHREHERGLHMDYLSDRRRYRIIGAIDWFWLSQINIIPGFWATPWHYPGPLEQPVCTGAVNVICEAILSITGPIGLSMSPYPPPPLSPMNGNLRGTIEYMNSGQSTYPPYAYNGREGKACPGTYAPLVVPDSLFEATIIVIETFHSPSPVPEARDIDSPLVRSQEDVERRTVELMRLDTWLFKVGSMQEIRGGRSSLLTQTPALVQRLIFTFCQHFIDADISGEDGGAQFNKEVACDVLHFLRHSVKVTRPEALYTLVAVLRAVKVRQCVLSGPDTSMLADIMEKDVQVCLV